MALSASLSSRSLPLRISAIDAHSLAEATALIRLQTEFWDTMASRVSRLPSSSSTIQDAVVATQDAVVDSAVSVVVTLLAVAFIVVSEDASHS